MPRNEKGTRIRGWILKNTRIDQVLNLKVCCHDAPYCIQVQIPSLFQDNNVTESMLPTKEEDMASGKPLRKQDQDRSPQ